MTRKIVTGLCAVLGVAAIGLLPTACSSAGVGDPCIPEDEYKPGFAGFTVSEEFIESRSFQCETRVCLVNYFQGRVSCPLGQALPTACTPDAGCDEGECVESVTLAPECTSNEQCQQFAGICNTASADSPYCECNPDNADTCPAGFTCTDVDGVKQCKSFVCHVPGGCQVAGAPPEENAGKDCCVPGTDTPVATSVCGQCDAQGGGDADRNADAAVYCSCRCDVAEGAEEEPDFNFCECPDGFSCEEIRKDLDLGDKQLTGKYCVKNGTATNPTAAETQCGQVNGAWNSECQGVPTGQFTGGT